MGLQNDDDNLKTRSMNYIIDCHHCGSHTEYYTSMDRRSKRAMALQQSVHIDTECAMRCPVCRARLNNSEAEFYAQVRAICEA